MSGDKDFQMKSKLFVSNDISPLIDTECSPESLLAVCPGFVDTYTL